MEAGGAHDLVYKELESLRVPETSPPDLCHKGKWLSLLSMKFKSRDGKDSVWDFCVRTRKLDLMNSDPGKHPSSFVDGTSIIPIIRRKDGKKDIVLVAEYRIPVGGRVLGFPGGLKDYGESAELCAMRELQEETGYTMDRCISEALPDIVSFVDPWKSNECENVVIAEIDGEHADNIKPKQDLEAEEDITVLIVPNLGPNTLDQAAAICQKYGMHMSSDLRRFLLGIKYASML